MCMLHDQAAELQAAEGLPEGLAQETESDFCFLCERPRRLIVPQQVKGQHKIWPLPAAAAKQFGPALKAVPQVCGFPFCSFHCDQLDSRGPARPAACLCMVFSDSPEQLPPKQEMDAGQGMAQGGSIVHYM